MRTINKKLYLLITCLLILGPNVFAKAEPTTKLNSFREPFKNGSELKGNFYLFTGKHLINGKKNGTGNNRYWKFDGESVANAQKNNQLSFIYKGISVKKIEIRLEKIRNKNLKNHSNISTVYLALLRTQNILIVNKNAFEYDKKDQYIAYRLTKDIVDFEKLKFNIFKTLNDAMDKAIEKEKKTGLTRAPGFRHSYWTIKMYYKKGMVVKTGNGFRNSIMYIIGSRHINKSTDGKIEIGYEKPDYWEHESFQIYRKGWNDSVDMILNVIRKLEN